MYRYPGAKTDRETVWNKSFLHQETVLFSLSVISWIKDPSLPKRNAFFSLAKKDKGTKEGGVQTAFKECKQTGHPTRSCLVVK